MENILLKLIVCKNIISYTNIIQNILFSLINAHIRFILLLYFA